MSATATSILAYAQVFTSLPKRRAEAFQAVIERGPMTGSEIDRALGSNSAHKRLAELAEMGLVEAARERPCKVTGRLCVEWRAVERLPDAPVKRAKRPSREDLEKEVAALRAQIEKLERRYGRQLALWGANQ